MNTCCNKSVAAQPQENKQDSAEIVELKIKVQRLGGTIDKIDEKVGAVADEVKDALELVKTIDKQSWKISNSHSLLEKRMKQLKRNQYDIIKEQVGVDINGSLQNGQLKTIGDEFKDEIADIWEVIVKMQAVLLTLTKKDKIKK